MKGELHKETEVKAPDRVKENEVTRKSRVSKREWSKVNLSKKSNKMTKYKQICIMGHSM